MGSFDSGMQLGLRAWNMAEDARLRQEQEDRLKREADLRNEALQYELSRRRAKDTAFEDLARRARGEAPPTAVTNPDWAPGEGGPSITADQQLPPAQGLPLSRSAITREAGQIALRFGDLDTFSKAQDAAKALEIEDVFNKGVKRFTDDPTYADRLYREVNLGSSRFTVSPMLGRDGKPNGYTQLSVVRPDGTAAFKQLSKAQLGRVAGAIALMEAGYANEALRHLEAVDKDVAAAVAAENNLSLEGTKANNQATHWSQQDDINRLRLDIERQNARIGRLGSPIQMVDKDNNPVLVVPTLTAKGIEFHQPQLPPGLQFPINPKVIEERAAALVNTPDPRNPRKKLTPAEAYNVAREQLYRGVSGGLPVVPPPPRYPTPAPAPTTGPASPAAGAAAWLPQNDPRRIAERYGLQVRPYVHYDDAAAPLPQNDPRRIAELYGLQVRPYVNYGDEEAE